MKKYWSFFLLSFVLTSFFAKAQTPQKIQFKETVHDFKEIVQGSKVTYSFEFTNLSDDLLVIQDVITTCGCTASEYPKKPIVPTVSDKITIIFDSKEKLGIQRKTITLKTNQGDIKLRIIANVILP